MTASAGAQGVRLCIMIRPLVAALTLLAACGAAHAQVTVDVSKITCEQYFRLPDADIFAVWLSGYYHGQKREVTVETEQLKENAKKVRVACRLPDNVSRPIMELIDNGAIK